jgi:hypothetical protein
MEGDIDLLGAESLLGELTKTCNLTKTTLILTKFCTGTTFDQNDLDSDQSRTGTTLIHQKRPSSDQNDLDSDQILTLIHQKRPVI